MKCWSWGAGKNSGQALVEWTVFGLVVFLIWEGSYTMGRKLLSRTNLDAMTVLAARKRLSEIKTTPTPFFINESAGSASSILCKTNLSFQKNRSQSLCVSGLRNSSYFISIPEAKNRAPSFWDWL